VESVPQIFYLLHPGKPAGVTGERRTGKRRPNRRSTAALPENTAKLKVPHCPHNTFSSGERNSSLVSSSIDRPENQRKYSSLYSVRTCSIIHILKQATKEITMTPMEMKSAGAPIMQSVDYSETTQEEQDEYDKSISKGGVTTPFPWKLHDMLDDMDRLDTHSVVTWQPHGRSFMVHKPKEFVEKIMPHYFNQTKVSIIWWFSLFASLLLLLTSVF
jgi:hypothetical protein